MWIWRQFPRQIAVDLRRFFGLHIKWWHRATRGDDGELLLSSYELLELLEHMPEDGAFKTAAERGGRWPAWQQMLAETVNEAYRLRSAYHVVNGGEAAGFDVEPLLFIDPVNRVARERFKASQAQEQAQAQDEFESAMGFS